ncbi:hypothetical protein TSAR_015204 [Trichomalopsis sarcophagae]|uniref:4Fe-4S ferredoxin-type domain-containing protein n=1 Tax=Trichomalopsis sarcophagae TaxID=543379 RepID=A0A232FG28_9HYME|nr:hypothetical protein TSAR_015204 [Trichomalopsis sarcophagae]
MGNSRSQHSQQPAGRSLCLLYLIRRSWKIVSLTAAAAASARSRQAKGAADDTDDCATDLSTASRCSGCKGCGYHQELNFDSLEILLAKLSTSPHRFAFPQASEQIPPAYPPKIYHRVYKPHPLNISTSSSCFSESDMAPNAEEDLLVSMPRGGAPHSAKERLRPPTYNPEDYAIALRRWGRRALGGQPDNGQNTLPSTCTSSSSGYASATGNGGGGGEMTLRQFTSVSELLNKLKADLRLAFPSFVQEFCSPPAEGISLLLETLRGVQLSQSAPPSATGPQTRRPRARRAALDELGCVECLAVCTERCPDAPRILAQAYPGLLALAVCLTSSLNRSRVLALQVGIETHKIKHKSYRARLHYAVLFSVDT